MDPLTKSPKPEKKNKISKKNNTKPKEEDEFEYTEEFSNFYFGYWWKGGRS